jgi:hypothetical protein
MNLLRVKAESAMRCSSLPLRQTYGPSPV